MTDAIAISAPFPEKLRCLFEPKRYKVLYGGRGGAKSWGVARALLIMGLQRPIRVLCARELQNSIAESVHKLLADQIDLLRLPYSVEKARIYNALGTEFFFEGIRQNTDKVKSYEGIDICWVEEAQRASHSSWEILIPTIRKPGSEIWVTFNPDLETDDTFQRFVKHPFPDEMQTTIFMSWRDNPWFPLVLMNEMEQLKARDYDEYLHVWEGQCRVLLEGAVYADELRDMVADKRFCRVPYDASTGVNVFFDLGYADYTAMWFMQKVGFEYHLIRFYQNHLKKFDFYLEFMQRQNYVYDTLWLPWDASSDHLGTKMTIEEQTRAKGFRVRIVPKLSLLDGINAARTIFPACFFDEQNCEDGIKALRHYHYEIIEEEGRLKKEPVHDWASHAADAFRYFAIGSKLPGRHGANTKITNIAERAKNNVIEAGRRGRAQALGWLGS